MLALGRKLSNGEEKCRNLGESVARLGRGQFVKQVQNWLDVLLENTTRSTNNTPFHSGRLHRKRERGGPHNASDAWPPLPTCPPPTLPNMDISRHFSSPNQTGPYLEAMTVPSAGCGCTAAIPSLLCCALPQPLCCCFSSCFSDLTKLLLGFAKCLARLRTGDQGSDSGTACL